METDERETLLSEILAYARKTGSNQGEVQALIVSGTLLVGFEQVAQGISNQTDALETLAESVDSLTVVVRDTLDETIRETSDELKDALIAIEEALTRDVKDALVAIEEALTEDDKKV